MLPLTSLLPSAANAAPAATQLRPAEVAAASATATTATVPPRTLETGVEVFSMWRDWSVNTQMLDRIAASGAMWVRVGVGWGSPEGAGPGGVSRGY